MPDVMSEQVVAVAVADDELAGAIVERFEVAGARVQRVLVSENGRTTSTSLYLQQAVDRILEIEGRLDVWIQDAHYEAIGNAVELSWQEWQDGLAASAGLAFSGAQAAGRTMLAQGAGAVVLITSVDGLLASAGRVVACCGAAAVMMLVKVLACEWAAHGVRVNAVACTSWLAPPQGTETVELTAAGISPARIPLGRPPRPGEIADAIFFLGSPHSSFVTGETLRLDGGWTGYHLF